MPPKDDYPNFVPVLDSPAFYCFSIDPDDEKELEKVTRFIYVGKSGDVRCMLKKSTKFYIFRNVREGTVLPVRVTRISKSGTTAKFILGLS